MNVVYLFMRKRLGVYSFLKTLELESICLEEHATFFLLNSWKFGQSYSRKNPINGHLGWSEIFFPVPRGL